MGKEGVPLISLFALIKLHISSCSSQMIYVFTKVGAFIYLFGKP
jgi:hypothetical protein